MGVWHYHNTNLFGKLLNVLPVLDLFSRTGPERGKMEPGPVTNVGPPHLTPKAIYICEYI
jgi:hypothetical protein